tara:strand:- start:10531 stop:11007 length:477 start_codon:yes stop_codon:yes gene_type:complete
MPVRGVEVISVNLMPALWLLLTASLFSLHAQATASHEIKSGTKWHQYEVVQLLLEDHVFTPDDVVFKLYQPYKLVLTNVSDEAKHDLVDENFFHAIVLKEIIVGGVSINTHHINSLLLKPNTTASLLFVPVLANEFEVYCTLPNHREEGMEGYFTIEP